MSSRRAQLGRRGTLFVVSAPSGAGKTTLCREARLVIPDLAYSVSATTRSPRAGEVNGVDFRFVSEPHFRAMLQQRPRHAACDSGKTSNARAVVSAGSGAADRAYGSPNGSALSGILDALAGIFVLLDRSF